jgi:hypothetical protein
MVQRFAKTLFFGLAVLLVSVRRHSFSCTFFFF